MALKSTPASLRPNATRSRLTASARQWGIDIVADPRRAERLAPLQHLHERLLGLLVEAEETDQLLQDVVLAAALQLEVDGVFGKKLAQRTCGLQCLKRRRNV